MAAVESASGVGFEHPKVDHFVRTLEDDENTTPVVSDSDLMGRLKYPGIHRVARNVLKRNREIRDDDPRTLDFSGLVQLEAKKDKAGSRIPPELGRKLDWGKYQRKLLAKVD